MDFFSKLCIITNLSKNRLKQLDKKEEQYTKIQELHKNNKNNKCRQRIVDYFVNETIINRLQTEKIYKGNVIKMFNNIEKNLQTIENHTQRFDKVVKSDNFCEELSNFIEYQNDIISELKSEQKSELNSE